MKITYINCCAVQKKKKIAIYRVYSITIQWLWNWSWKTHRNFLLNENYAYLPLLKFSVFYENCMWFSQMKGKKPQFFPVLRTVWCVLQKGNQEIVMNEWRVKKLFKKKNLRRKTGISENQILTDVDVLININYDFFHFLTKQEKRMFCARVTRFNSFPCLTSKCAEIVWFLSHKAITFIYFFSDFNELS